VHGGLRHEIEFNDLPINLANLVSSVGVTSPDQQLSWRRYRQNLLDGLARHDDDVTLEIAPLSDDQLRALSTNPATRRFERADRSRQRRLNHLRPCPACEGAGIRISTSTEL